MNHPLGFMSPLPPFVLLFQAQKRKDGNKIELKSPSHPFLSILRLCHWPPAPGSFVVLFPNTCNSPLGCPGFHCKLQLTLDHILLSSLLHVLLPSNCFPTGSHSCFWSWPSFPHGDHFFISKSFPSILNNFPVHPLSILKFGKLLPEDLVFLLSSIPKLPAGSPSKDCLGPAFRNIPSLVTGLFRGTLLLQLCRPSTDDPLRVSEPYYGLSLAPGEFQPRVQ